MQRMLLRDFVRPEEHCHFAGVTLCSPWRRNEHTHDFAEAFLVLSGSGRHAINGQFHPLQKGMLVAIRPEDAHSFVLPEKEELQIVNVAFRMNAWRLLWRRYFDTPDPMSRDVSTRHRMLSPAEGNAILLAAEDLRNGRRSKLQTDRFLLQVMEILAQSSERARPHVAMPRWLAIACQQIERPDNFRGGTPVLAELAGRSPEHVARTLRRCIDQTPTDVINAARLKFAADRLAGGDAKILTIALDCGLSNLAHFYSLFKRQYGVTPRAYRLLQNRVVGG